MGVASEAKKRQAPTKRRDGIGLDGGQGCGRTAMIMVPVSVEVPAKRPSFVGCHVTHASVILLAF